MRPEQSFLTTTHHRGPHAAAASARALRVPLLAFALIAATSASAQTQESPVPEAVAVELAATPFTDAPAVEQFGQDAGETGQDTSVPDMAGAQEDPQSAAMDEDPRTAAERDYQAIYGQAGVPSNQYDPVADATLPAPALIGTAYDPWQRYNRQMHRFNNVVDRKVARPLAQAYVRIVPRPLRLGVSNFFSNLGQPVSAVNALLQGRPKQAAQAAGRFALNSTLGIGGIFNPASDADLPNKSEDFGQTLGVWGWRRSRYVELPLFGPRTVRDVFGMVGDAPLSPLRQVDADRVRIPVQGLQLVDVRTQLLSTDSLREGAEDDYALVRDAWSQRRDYQIFGDRLAPGDDALPDYLLDDTTPIVPVDVMPVMPTDIN